ncbi:MAG: hypothetical protein R3Y62_08065, partial [Eubacteriales bacterium]
RLEKPEIKLPQQKPPVSPAGPQKKDDFFQKMDSAKFQEFVEVVKKPTAPPVASVVVPKPDLLDDILPVASPVMKPTTTGKPKVAPPILPPISEPEAQIVMPELPKIAPPKTVAPAPEPVQVEVALETAEVRLIGEAMHTYLIVEMDETVYFIDKHAAHERILFEKLQAQDVEIMSQLLLVPVTVKMEPKLANAVLENLGTLRNFGLEAEEFGVDTIILRQIPDFLDETKAGLLLEELAESLASGQKTDPKTLRSHVHHSMACKAAIKGGWTTDTAEQLALVKEVLSRDDIKFCPHGRPITIQLTKKELEKQFKRS